MLGAPGIDAFQVGRRSRVGGSASCGGTAVGALQLGKLAGNAAAAAVQLLLRLGVWLLLLHQRASKGLPLLLLHPCRCPAKQ